MNYYTEYLHGLLFDFDETFKFIRDGGIEVYCKDDITDENSKEIYDLFGFVGY